MILLLKRVLVLILTTFTTCDTSLPNASPEILEKCQVDLTVECALDLLNQIRNRTAQELPQETVENYLNKVMNVTTFVKDNNTDRNKLISYGNGLLDVTEKLVSALVRKTDTIESISISLQSLEVRVLMIGQNTSVNEISSLITSTASMDIKLIGTSKNNNASVAFMSYTNMSGILKPRFFKTRTHTQKTMMSAVVSANLPQASATDFTTVNFTLKHVDKLDPEDVLSCVYWNDTEWVEDGCSITEQNGTHAVCSCDRQGTFTLIMQTYPRYYASSSFQISINWIISISVSSVGMIFLILTILTLAFCRLHTKTTKTVLINLCINLLLAMLFTNLMPYIRLQQRLFVVLVGFLSFFWLSAGMWMLIDGVLLLIFVKNLSKVRSNQREDLRCIWLIVIGYFIPLVLVVVYALVFPGYYDRFM